MCPIDAIKVKEAARILGTSKSRVARQVLTGWLTSRGGRYEHRTQCLAEVEDLECEVCDRRRHTDDSDSYLVGSHDAAEMLGVSRQRLGQLGDKRFVPFVRHRGGVRLYRRS